MKPRAAISLRQRALQHLAQREHTRQELRAKLLRWLQALETVASTTALASGAAAHAATHAPPASEADVDALLDQLQQGGQLSDDRFVESRVHARVGRFGNRRIEHELRMHGAEASPELRSELHASEFDRACAVWQRKFGHAPAGAAERLRQMRFLAGRGFSAETIGRVMRHGSDHEPQPGAHEAASGAAARLSPATTGELHDDEHALGRRHG